MTNRILIIGGRGRIGSSVAQDILTHTDAEITVTGCDSEGSIPAGLPPGSGAISGFKLSGQCSYEPSSFIL
jgi:nucleoside-diphosphate-sugar epimerase